MLTTRENIQAAMRRLGYRVSEGDLSLNLVGIRSTTARAGKYDDLFCVFWKEKGEWNIELHSCTTDPGLYYLHHPMNRSGAAVLVPGQYIDTYAIDLHNGSYEALCQRLGKVRVYRDNDKDSELDIPNKIEEGFFGINIHYDSGEPDGGSGNVYKASAGCQVIRKKKAFDRIMELARRHRDKYGNRFTYTLITDRDLEASAEPEPELEEEPQGEMPDIGRFILDKEARRDKHGNLMIYKLPEGDGGGAFEVAGINEKYHPTQAYKLKTLIEQGKYAEAERSAAEYILKYTMSAASWHPDVRVACFLRDCVFNRGATGAAKILQHALVTAGTLEGSIDGKVGNLTKTAARKHSAEDLLPRLLLSRQWYERVIVKRDESSKFWSGLVNRWVDALQLSLEIGDPYKFGE